MQPIQTIYRFALNDANNHQIIEEICRECEKMVQEPDSLQENLQRLIKSTPFAKVLDHLLVHSPLCFLQVLPNLPHHERETFLHWIENGHTENHMVQLLTAAIETLIESKLPFPLKSRTVTCLLVALPSVKRAQLYYKGLNDLALNTLCQWVNLIHDKKIQQRWLRHLVVDYEKKGALFELCDAVLKLTLPVNYHHPEIVKLLLKIQTQNRRIDDYIMINLNLFDDACQYQFLRNLNAVSLEHTLMHFQNTEGVEWYADVASKLIGWELKPVNCILLMKIIINSTGSYYIHDFCRELIDTDSNAIKWLLPAFAQSGIYQLCHLDVEQREQILKGSLPKEYDFFKAAHAALSHEAKVTLFNSMRLNIISQRPTNNDLGTGGYATFQEIFDDLKNALEDQSIEDFMNIYKKDFRKCPAILIALGLEDETFSPTILKTVSYMNEDQLMGVCHGIELFFSVDKIQTLIAANVNTDYFETIIESLSKESLATLLSAKTNEMKEQTNQFLEMYTSFEASFDKLKNPLGDGNYQQTVTLCQEAFHLLVKIITPYNQILTIAAKKKNQPPFFQMSSLWNKNKEIMKLFKDPNHGHLAELQKYKPKTDLNEPTFHWKEKLPELFIKCHSFEKLKAFGLNTDGDIECLSSQYKTQNLVDIITKYIDQYEHMSKLWYFFRQKHFSSLKDLVENEVIQSPEDTLKLKEIGIKMGYAE